MAAATAAMMKEARHAATKLRISLSGWGYLLKDDPPFGQFAQSAFWVPGP
jgi:hypothetical protein